MRYERIAVELQQRIADGEWGPGVQLPPHRELAAAFGATPVTVRRALQRLADDGWVRIEHGTGTFVDDLGSGHDDLPLASFHPSPPDAGGIVDSVLLGVALPASHPEAAAALGLEPDRDLVRVDRLRRLDGVPVVLQSSYLDGVHGRVLQAYAAEVPLYVFLRERLGLVATSSEETLEAVAASEPVAQTLGVAEQTPVLRSRKRSRSRHRDTFLYDDAHIASSHLALVIRRSGAVPEVAFAGPPVPRSAVAS